MPKSQELKNKLEDLKKKYLDARKKENAEKSKRARSIDTRKKILYGGMVIKTEPQLLPILKSKMEEKDRKWIDIVDGICDEPITEKGAEDLIPASLKEQWNETAIFLDTSIIKILRNIKDNKEDDYEKIIKTAIEVTLKNAKSNRAKYFKKVLPNVKI